MGKGGGPFGAVVRPLRVLVTFVSEEGQEGTGEKKTKENQIERERSTKESARRWLSPAKRTHKDGGGGGGVINGRDNEGRKEGSK